MNFVLTFLLSPRYFMYMQIFQNQKNKTNKQIQIQNASCPEHFGQKYSTHTNLPGVAEDYPGTSVAIGKSQGPGLRLHLSGWHHEIFQDDAQNLGSDCSYSSHQMEGKKDSFLGKMILLCSGLSFFQPHFLSDMSSELSFLLTVLDGIRPS